jgi:hypothetical protein
MSFSRLHNVAVLGAIFAIPLIVSLGFITDRG